MVIARADIFGERGAILRDNSPSPPSPPLTGPTRLGEKLFDYKRFCCIGSYFVNKSVRYGAHAYVPPSLAHV